MSLFCMPLLSLLVHKAYIVLCQLQRKLFRQRCLLGLPHDNSDEVIRKIAVIYQFCIVKVYVL